MYIIVSYDVNALRCNKINKLLKRYLFHVHNSVFEGELTQKQFQDLKSELEKITVSTEDKIIFYQLLSDKYLRKDYIGTHENYSIFY